MKEKKDCKKLLVLLCLTVTMMMAIGITAFAATVQVGQTYASESSVKVAWGQLQNFEGYYCVQLAETSNFSTILKEEVVKSSWNSWSFSGLTAGKTYYVRIGASQTRNGSYVLIGSTVLITSPTKPATVSFVDASDSSVKLSWSAVTGATGYAITYNGKTYDNITGTSYSLPFSADTSVYAVARVYAYRNEGAQKVYSGSYASISGMTSLTSKIKKSDFGMTALYSSTGKACFGVNRSTVKGTGFEIELTPKKGSKKVLKSDTMSEQMTKYKKGMLYKYRARAYVKLTNGEKKYGTWSDYRNFATAKNLKSKSYSGGATLSWKKITGLSKIVVKVSTKKDGKYKTVATLKGSATSYRITKYNNKALSRGKTYYYEVFYYSKFGTKKHQVSEVIGTGSFYVPKWY